MITGLCVTSWVLVKMEKNTNIAKVAFIQITLNILNMYFNITLTCTFHLVAPNTPKDLIIVMLFIITSLGTPLSALSIEVGYPEMCKL